MKTSNKVWFYLAIVSIVIAIVQTMATLYVLLDVSKIKTLLAEQQDIEVIVEYEDE